MRVLPPLAFAALGLALWGIADARGDAGACPAGFSEGLSAGTNRGYTVAGQDRTVVAGFPATSSAPAPLFVAFNGTGETGASFWARAELDRFVAKGFVVLAPSSAGNGTLWPVWDALRPKGHEGDDNADVALFDSLLACVSATRPIDPARVYIGGHSAGGIFSNHLLQRRADVLAGAIVASGIYSQTAPVPAPPLAPLTVIVTTGGDNDRWSGRAGSVAVRDFSFVAEAGVAARTYQKAGLDVVSCKGRELGHAWLDGLDDWMADLLLARPKGAAALTTLPALPVGADAACVLGPMPEVRAARMTCPESTVAGCTAVCQGVVDGAAQNTTVGPVLRAQLRNLGVDGDCSACVAKCEALATTEDDTAALACFSAQPPVDPDVGGIAGAMPLVDAVNTCCAAHPGSRWCGAVCTEMKHNLAARGWFDGCR